MLAAYAADPSLAAVRADFADLLRQAVAVTISGLLARQEDLPVGSAPIEIAHQPQ